MYGNIVLALWTIWGLYWLVSARNTKTTRRRESAASRAADLIPMILGILLMALPIPPNHWLAGHPLPRTFTTYWIGVALIAIGLGFSVWARMHLGSNWSGTVTLKESHQLVRSGPYGWVRHPIYTGLLLAILGSAVARNEWRAAIGFALVVIALIRRVRIEERWMREVFGANYEAYQREVRALVPFIV